MVLHPNPKKVDGIKPGGMMVKTEETWKTHQSKDRDVLLSQRRLLPRISNYYFILKRRVINGFKDIISLITFR